MSENSATTGRSYFFERRPWSYCWLGWLLGLAIAIVDFLLGPFFVFPVFFALPVMLMAWNCGRGQANFLAVALS